MGNRQMTAQSLEDSKPNEEQSADAVSTGTVASSKPSEEKRADAVSTGIVASSTSDQCEHEGETCTCSDEAKEVKKGVANCMFMTPQDWRPTLGEKDPEMTSWVISLGDEKSGGKDFFSGKKFPSWPEAINSFVQECLIPGLTAKFGGQEHLVGDQELVQKIREFTLQMFMDNVQLGLCITRRGGHFISMSDHCIQYLVDYAMEHAKKKSICPASGKPLVVMKENCLLVGSHENPSYQDQMNGTQLPCTQNILVVCPKDRSEATSHKFCQKLVSFAKFTENLRRLSILLKETSFPEPLTDMNVFENMCIKLESWADMMEMKRLEIAHVIDSTVVSRCPKTCDLHERPLVVVRTNFGNRRWGRPKLHTCSSCHVYYCTDCGEESHPDARHVCNRRHHFETLPESDKKEILDNLGTKYQFCPNQRCNMVISKLIGCDKMRCSECNTSFCLACGVTLDPANYFGEHLISLGNGTIPCRFSFVAKACRTLSEEQNANRALVAEQNSLRAELINSIELGNRMIFGDFARIASEPTRYDFTLHEQVKEALRRSPLSPTHLSPEQLSRLIR